MTDDYNPVHQLLVKLASEREHVMAALEDAPTRHNLTADEMATGMRLIWIFRAAAAHSQGAMPWRANPPTNQDAEWCDQVCYAVRDKRARPPHPEAEIEQMLVDALPT